MDSQMVLDLDNGVWSLENPARCECHGRGWIVSDWDTYHRCRIHGQGVPHPEDDANIETFDFAAHTLRAFRDAYCYFAVVARENGFKGSWAAFARACAARMETRPTPEAWVNAAEEIAEELRSAAADESARREGYACDLERRWTEEGARERRDRGTFH